jgi:hypothetical protein
MKNLTTYLNDHLGGSVAALELLDHLIETYEAEPLRRFFHELRGEIEADQATLQQLIQKLGAQESKVRKAAGWIAEKLSRGAIPLHNAEKSKMGLFLALETLGLGITGKHSLWHALAEATKNNPLLAELDYATLRARALEQRNRVEIQRLQVASEIFNDAE